MTAVMPVGRRHEDGVRLAASHETDPRRDTRTGVDDINLLTHDDAAQLGGGLKHHPKSLILYGKLIMRNACVPKLTDQTAPGGDDDTTMAVSDQIFGQVDRSCFDAADV
jgi:hypothetical protein